MSKSKNPSLRLIVNKGVVERQALKEETKVSIWNALTWHTKLQIFVFAILLVAFIASVISYMMGDSSAMSTFWIISTFCMCFVWVLEYKKRIETDHIRGY